MSRLLVFKDLDVLVQVHHLSVWRLRDALIMAVHVLTGDAQLLLPGLQSSPYFIQIQLHLLLVLQFELFKICLALLTNRYSLLDMLMAALRLWSLLLALHALDFFTTLGAYLLDCLNLLDLIVVIRI